ncbi:MAG: AbrB/MazE/SpoVT family DNA-binding domain-containing protein [Chloroflexi bacterium]|nr:AbrB/MazE/SpoVT family DNA-binding domain-containing protein [Chloroflexota bacterium]
MLQRTARITSKGQVTIPAEVRRLLGVRPKDKVAFIVDKNQVRLAPAQSIVARTAGMLKSSQPPLSPEEEKVAAEEAMADEVEKRS